MENIRIVNSSEVTECVKELFIKANHLLPECVKKALDKAAKEETSELARSVIKRLSENIDIAKECDVPVCQDTGMAIILAEVGNDGKFSGDVAEALGFTSTMLKSLVRRSVKMDFRGHRIELKREE